MNYLFYVSIVMAVRNDNYGGDFNFRLGNSIMQLINITNELKQPIELVLVNYNYIADNEPLSEMIKETLACPHPYLVINMIEVPNEVHRQYINTKVRKTVPLFEFIAKNIGIRRAKGAFILTTNADIIFTKEIFQFIKKQKLQQNTYYRCNRINYDRAIDVTIGTPEKIFDDLATAVVNGYFKGGLIKWFSTNLSFMVNYNLLKLISNIRQIVIYYLCTLIYRYNKEDKFLADGFSVKRHCHASGDFVLMHRQHWFQLMGTPENTWISTHADSLFLVRLYLYELKEVVLAAPIFHQEHQRRYDFNNPSKDMQKAYQFYIKYASEMLISGKDVLKNDDNWGLPNAKLKTITL